MTQPTIELTGLDGQNPLGFFAALGLLRILDAQARGANGDPPRLRFVETPPYVARLSWHEPLERIEERVLADASAQSSSVALGLAYDEQGTLCSPSSAGATRDLKPSPAGARAYLTRAAGAGRREADLAGAFVSDMVQDNNGATKPTAFHFTAGQQAFLQMVEELRVGVDGPALREALLGPWRNESKLPSLAWDSSVARLYALRAANPSGEKRGSVAGANWLAVHGLAFFPVMPARGRLRTTGVDIGWKDVPFTWPLWTEPAQVGPIAALLRLDPTALTQRARHAVGVSAVFRSHIRRTEQGGYGSFSPAEALLPR